MSNHDAPLVLGAAGFLGLNTVHALRDRGLAPVCGRRRRTNVLVLRRLGLPMVHADLDAPEKLTETMRGFHTVIHCAAHYPRFSLDPEEALGTGLRQLDNALDAAANAGVRRLVFVSTTSTVAPRTDGGPSTEADSWPERPTLGVYHALKWELEQRVLAEIRLETRIACPGACIGPWDLRVGTSALLVALARGLDPVHPDGWVNLVDARDVGRALAELATRDDAPRRVLLSGSSHRLHGLLEQLAERFGVPRPRPAASPAEALAFADATERHAAMHGGRAELSREIVDLVLHAGPIDAGLAEQQLGMRWTPLDQTLDAWETWARRLRILEPHTGRPHEPDHRRRPDPDDDPPRAHSDSA